MNNDFIKIHGVLHNKKEGNSITDDMFVRYSSIVCVYKIGLNYYLKLITGETYRICMADYYDVVRKIENT